jgi:ubiquinone/menaquinone biosynthesis C-methylase UbiE
MKISLDDWASSVLADPITKEPKQPQDFAVTQGVLDARVLLKNSMGFSVWDSGQAHFEDLEISKHYLRKSEESFEQEILRDAVVYETILLEEPILDVGGSCGLLREFLKRDSQYLVVDPFINALQKISPARIKSYKCLEQPLNFIAGVAEFLPIQTASVRTVHMRSMLDHVQIVDLCLLEAKRVLMPKGKLIIGITIEGQPYGKIGRDLGLFHAIKKITKTLLTFLGVKRYRDAHVWHPTYSNLMKILADSGFVIIQEFWQPAWKGRVLYVEAKCESLG